MILYFAKPLWPPSIQTLTDTILTVNCSLYRGHVLVDGSIGWMHSKNRTTERLAQKMKLFFTDSQQLVILYLTCKSVNGFEFAFVPPYLRPIIS